MKDECWCGESEISGIEETPIRTLKDPVHGNRFVAGRILTCRGCGTKRLDSQFRIPQSWYAGDEYRKAVGETGVPSEFLEKHSALQKTRITHLGLEAFRGKRVLDIGAGAGGFLHEIKHVASALAAIEPNVRYQNFLKNEGILVIDENADTDLEFDVVVCLETIEHVDRPQDLIRVAKHFLARYGWLILTTPNVDNPFMDVTGFRENFYRNVHNWYFGLHTLGRLVFDGSNDSVVTTWTDFTGVTDADFTGETLCVKWRKR